jgi:hypothetical protein
LHLYFTKCLIVIQNGRLHYSPPTCQSDNERGGRGGSPRQYIQQCVYLYVHGVVVVVVTNKSFFFLLFLLDIIFSRLVCRADRESHYLSTRDCLNCSRLITGTTTIICKGRQVHPDVFISSSSLVAARRVYYSLLSPLLLSLVCLFLFFKLFEWAHLSVASRWRRPQKNPPRMVGATSQSRLFQLKPKWFKKKKKRNTFFSVWDCNVKMRI